MKYAIRELTAQDDAALEAVIRVCLIEYGANHVGTAWADPFLSRLSTVYGDERNRYWVAVSESGRVVGGAGIGGSEFADEVCELQKMYCLPECRGIGVSHMLMDKCLAFAKARYRCCFLETLHNMVAAQRFYEKYGFVRTDERFGDAAHFSCDVRYILDL